MLASFIAVLSIRFRLSRQKIQEFLADWLGLGLGTASIDRCIREFGLACEPVVEDLIEEISAAEVVRLDETPWYQRGTLLWLWVATTATVVVFRIGSRAREELTALIGEVFLGWLVSDGYVAYRDHPRRQRGLAHLIRRRWRSPRATTMPAPPSAAIPRVICAASSRRSLPAMVTHPSSGWSLV
jgi:transposase